MAENASALNIDISTNFLESKTLWLAVTKKEASAAIDLVMGGNYTGLQLQQRRSMAVHIGV